MRAFLRNLGALCLLPLTLLYLYGTFFILIFVAGSRLWTTYLWAAAWLIPGFALYAVWQLLHIVTLPSYRASANSVAMHLWIGIAIGLVVTAVILIGFPLGPPSLDSVLFVVLFGSPAVIAVALIGLHLHLLRSDKTRSTDLSIAPEEVA